MFFLYSSTPKRIEDIFTELGSTLLDHYQWIETLEQLHTLAGQESTVLFLILDERPQGAFFQLKEKYPHWKVVLLSQQIGEQQLREWQQGQADFYDLFYKYPVPWPVVSSTLKLVSTFVASSWNKISAEDELKLDGPVSSLPLESPGNQQEQQDHAFLQLTEAADLELDLESEKPQHQSQQQSSLLAALTSSAVLPAALDEGFDLSLSQLIAPVEDAPLLSSTPEVLPSEPVANISEQEPSTSVVPATEEFNSLEELKPAPEVLDTTHLSAGDSSTLRGYQDWRDQLHWREEKIISLQRKLELFEKDREYAKQKNRELQQRVTELEKKYAGLLGAIKSILSEAEQPMNKVLHSKVDPYDF